MRPVCLVLLFFLMISCSQEPVQTSRVVQEKPSTLPKVIPVLDCKPSDRDGLGKAILSTLDPVKAGSIQTFEITFTVGPRGIAPNGFVLLQVSPWWGWSQPQTQYPKAPGFVRVKASFEDPSLEVIALQTQRVIVFSRNRAMEEGDTLTLYYGPARVDKFAESRELFQIFTDGDGDGHYACIKNTPYLAIHAREPRRIVVNCPSRASPKETLKITAAPVDIMGNWSAFSAGKVTFTLLDHDLKPVEGKAHTMEAKGGEKLLTHAFDGPKEGIYFFGVKDASGLIGKSNVLFCQEGAPKLNLYFGDIHGHTRLSDGTGTPKEYYEFARDVAGVQISAITDHADWGTIPFKEQAWDLIKKQTEMANDPGSFITFAAYEWTNWVSGHRNVYFRDGDGPVFRSIDPESDTPQELWALLKPYEAMTIAHHVGGGPIKCDWSIKPDPMERLVEISSVHGVSEVYMGEKCIYRPVRNAFVRDALSRGYRLGIMASGDTHDGHPGRRSPGSVSNGLMGVYAPELTRNAVWTALKKRHVYGTSGPKILLFFRVCDSPMGSETSWTEKQGSVPIAVMAMGCDRIKSVEIIRNNETVYQEKGDGVMVHMMIRDTQPLKGESWYYARILQEDGEMAWSSPVWVSLK